MRTVHEASVNEVNYKYYETKENSAGAIKGVMYEKIDKKNGETKLKSGSNALEKLLMEARGYTALKESSAKKFLNAMFPKAPLSEGSILTTPRYKSAGKSKDVVSSNYFHKTFENQQITDEKKQASDLIMAVNNQHRNLVNISG
jgi:hypothetical protein